MIRLRPHHLLCLLAFSGQGYSQEFIGRMHADKAALLANQSLTFGSGPDGICSYCPQLDGTGCLSDGVGVPADELDARVKALLNLQDDRPYVLSDFARELFTIGEAGLSECCRDCRWLAKSNCPAVIIQTLAGLFPDLNS